MNFEKIAQMMGIVQATRDYPDSPVFKPIHDAAMREIEAAASEPGDMSKVRVVTPPAGPANSAVEICKATPGEVRPQLKAGEVVDKTTQPASDPGVDHSDDARRV